MATLREVIQEELRARGYRQSEEDPAYWTPPDDDWSDKLLAAVRDCFEREENIPARPQRDPGLLHGIGSLADLTGKQIRLYAKQIVQADPCSFCGYYTRDPDPAKRKRVKAKRNSSKKGMRNIATVDHIVPQAAGGADNSDNYTGACRHCNGKKNDKSLLFFLLERQEAQGA